MTGAATSTPRRRGSNSESSDVRTTSVDRYDTETNIIHMKTTVDIPEDELREAMESLGVRTKREAILTALRELNRRRRMARLVRHSDTLDFLANEELEALERGEQGEPE